jgi:hypothetical protein
LDLTAESAKCKARGFGLAIVLNDKGAYRWNAFRTRLVERIADGNPD